jgi:hypothetical protein
MDRPHPLALRERVITCVEAGYSHRSPAARLWVSVKFVNDMIILKRATGGLVPRVQGNGWSPKGAWLIDHAPFGRWNTQTFIAALRHDRLDAP